MKADDQLKQIADAKRSGFRPGENTYDRGDGVIMVEITPGSFVNETTARLLGVKPGDSR
jgi:hypothetical protein